MSWHLSITLYDNTGATNVPIDIYWTDNDYVTFGPRSNLVNGHNYTVTIGTGVKDPSGNGLSSPYTWSFTVAGTGVDSDPVIEWGFGGDNKGTRWTDGTTRVQLYLGASDDHTDPLTVTAATGSKNWTLTKHPGQSEYEYESKGNEGLSSGTHTLTFMIKDGASPQNTVTFQRDIFIFDSNPTLSSPANRATGIFTTPTFQWSYGGTLRPVAYVAAVLDGPNLETARMIWQGWMVDTGPGTYSISIPPDKPLAPNTTYYWAVGGQNDDETSETISQVWSFTTGGTPPPMPSFSWVRVRSENRPAGLQWSVGAKIVGPSPADIRELKATGPGGFQYIFTEDDIFQGEYNGLYFWRGLTSVLVNGTYTFTVADFMGRTATSNFNFTSASVARADSATMSPSDNAYIGTTTPTFSWGSVGSGNYYYRIQVFDWNFQEDAIWTTNLFQNTQITIPSGYLLPNTPYKWRVEAFDSSQINRSVSNYLGFSTGSYPYTLDIQGPTWSDNAYYSGQRRVFQALISGPLPPHISSLTVTGPGGFNHAFTESEIRWSHVIGNVYSYGESGLPADGAYDYNIVDTFEGSDSFSKDQTSTPIPIVDLGSLSPANNAYLNTLTPTFTWSGVKGSPRYYRISINDWKERYVVYQSTRSTELFATIPAGVLKPERSYKWRVEVFDDSDGLVADNRSSSGWNCFTTPSNQQQQYTLTVTKSGTGSGTVTSSPAGINCGDDCSEDYSNIQKVKLTAKADVNSTFAGWSGGDCSGTGTCTVAVDAVITVTASFALKVPDISVAQTTLDFGSVNVGKKITKTLKIANNGSGDLWITLSGLEGTDFSIQGSSSITIKAKKSYNLKVLCTPTSGGLKTATLSIVSNDPDTPTLEISLTAVLPATTPDISVAQTLDFGSVKVGKKVTKTLKIGNIGTGDLMITLSGLEETDFSTQGSSSVTIKAKKSYSLKVLFTPTSADLKTATLKITSNDPDTPTLEISLTGTGQ